MTITGFDSLLCPLDGDPLQRHDTTWRCAAGHSFDIARQGYVHLLPVQNKRSRDPGDSREMVAARARFLEAGFFKPLATAVARAALEGLPADAPASLLDAGCGEGYYLRQLAAAAGLRQSLALLGLDISKWAVLTAARTDPRPTWVVASNARLPVPAQSIDRVLCLFGFPVYPEFTRVLKPGGELLLADPGPAHLQELREIIYPTLKPVVSEEAAVPEGFTRVAVESVTYPMILADSQMIADLLAMTPHLYRASAAGKEKLLERSRLAVTVDVRLTRLRLMA
ncbi:methyltransferase domain-containing protein [Haliea sp. E1-2-M8]|uniref:putative RNA methyltransferase n=1 Tax=Haliea sp. E1-2-M8 TaxID=3064706 RepID=UPI00271916D2|nr:methyltransferase domain-containing protein [Haliea sp. E1-2-M8]MDO8860322.1 methyltransferase domain-containing protein [Haliea sp. E1-2-M8]